MRLRPEDRTKSNQGWRTPAEFLVAIERKFGLIDFDLAATAGHQVTQGAAFFSPEEDSLSREWGSEDPGAWKLPSIPRVRYLNPPFAHIAPWAAKLSACQHLPAWTLMLVPASIGSMWWQQHILGKMMIFGIPRITFRGATAPYPKDLALLCAGFGVHGNGYWDWRKNSAPKTPPVNRFSSPDSCVNLTAPDWKRLKIDVRERIDALAATMSDMCNAPPELKAKLYTDLVLPNVRLLSEFCANVTFDDDDDREPLTDIAGCES